MEYVIPPEYDGVRAEQYLRSVHGYSGRLLIRLKKSPAYLRRNGAHLRVVDPVYAGDRLEVLLEDTPHTPPNHHLQVPIVYEDDDLMVFCKPAKMPIHPSRNHPLDTLGNFFAAYCEQTHQPLVFRPVTRLDADTTGLCVVAKNMLSGSKLAAKVEKEYLALVSNGDTPLPDHGVINAPIGRENGDGIRRCVTSNGKSAITHYQVLARGAEYTTVLVYLQTGRTHQIRVHFAHLGHPLIGDEMYGGDCSEQSTHALHCYRLQFRHPTQPKNVYLCSDPPSYFGIIPQNTPSFLHNL